MITATVHNRLTLSVLWKLLFCVCLVYSGFSYALADPNLILSSWQPYWRFQQWMWQTFFHNRELLTIAYGGFIVSFWLIYGAGLRLVSNQTTTLSFNQFRATLLSLLLALSPLLLSYNALSHDVFNYIFNAKMVVVYQANPHVQTATDFARDDWTRFMHNTHTPAPYGYGWTALSLLPYALGLGKFFSTWLVFRLFSVVSIIFLAFVFFKTAHRFSLKYFWLVLANPLLFLEIIANQHNDLWMMAPAVLSFGLLLQKPSRKKYAWLMWSISLALLLFSVSIKLATGVLIPLWLLAVIRPKFTLIAKHFSAEKIFLYASLLLFLPLLTLRSQQFLPWYLMWSLVWLPYLRRDWWQKWIVVFSLSALARYVPWLWAGEFTPEVLAQQKWVVWAGGIVLWLMWWGWSSRPRARYNRKA